MRFRGKRVLVTGASRGIGRAIAIAFAKEGANVALVYRSNVEAMDATIASLPGKGHFGIQCDVSEPHDAEACVEEAATTLGGLDVVVNNAGIFTAHPIAETDFAEWQAAWRRTLATNLFGPAWISWAAAQILTAQRSGRLINVSSRGAFRGEPDAPAYGASKAGLNAMSQSLAVALAPFGVFVGAVAPGFVATDMATDALGGPDGDAIRQQSPLNRVAEPEEVANAVLMLASEGMEFATGAILDVNGASYLR